MSERDDEIRRLARFDDDVRTEDISDPDHDLAPPPGVAAGALPGGYIIADRYQLDGVIGSGGMGTVYRARDLRLVRDVAVKILHHVRGARDSERFRREMVSMAASESPHVVPIFDAGQDGQLQFLVMKLMNARTLAEVVRGEGPLSPGRAISLADQLLQGLACVHDKGFVHRDVKPSNIMVDDKGWVTLLDMGIVLDPSATSLTTQRTVLGTPRFMSPEQRFGNQLDARSDLYAVGLVLLETLSGGLRGNDVADPSQLPCSRYLAQVAPTLYSVLERALAARPADRFPSAQAMRDALAEARDATADDVLDAPYNPVVTARNTRGMSSSQATAGTRLLVGDPMPARPTLDAGRSLARTYILVSLALLVMAGVVLGLLLRS